MIWVRVKEYRLGSLEYAQLYILRQSMALLRPRKGAFKAIV
jgi:hypothetical protein